MLGACAVIAIGACCAQLETRHIGDRFGDSLGAGVRVAIIGGVSMRKVSTALANRLAGRSLCSPLSVPRNGVVKVRARRLVFERDAKVGALLRRWS